MKISERLNKLQARINSPRANSKSAMANVKDILARRREAREEQLEESTATNPNINMASIDMDFVSKRGEKRVLITIETKRGSFVDIEVDMAVMNTLPLNRVLTALQAI